MKVHRKSGLLQKESDQSVLSNWADHLGILCHSPRALGLPDAVLLSGTASDPRVMSEKEAAVCWDASVCK